MAPLDPDAVAAVLEQLCPAPRDPDELHDLLLSLVACRPYGPWQEWFAALAADGRATELDGCWVATERREAATALGTDDEAAAACVGRAPAAGRAGDGRRARGRRTAATGCAPGCAALRGAGTHRAGPAGGYGRGDRAARRALVRAPPAGPAARGRPAAPARPGRGGAHLGLRAVLDPLAARHAGVPARGPGRAARGVGAVGGDRGAGGGVGGPGSPAARPRLRPALARRAVPVGRGGLGAAHAAGRADRAQRHTVARHAARLRQCATSWCRCCAPCGPGRRRPSPRWVRGPTCSPRCAPAAPASGPSSPR